MGREIKEHSSGGPLVEVGKLPDDSNMGLDLLEELVDIQRGVGLGIEAEVDGNAKDEKPSIDAE